MDSFNMASSDKENILDQLYIKQIVRNLMIFDKTKIHTNIGLALKPNFMSSLLL